MDVSSAPIVRVRGLVKTYRRGPEAVHALQGVSFELVAGEMVALVGPSGSGKTTLLNVLVGWEAADSGDVAWSWDGDKPPAERLWDDLAILPQRLGLVDELTVRENLALPIRLGRHPSAPYKVEELLDDLGLMDLGDRLPDDCSLGEQQRTALARALVCGPRLLLADEPTGHQDAGWGTAVVGAMRAACDEGTSCLIATHNTELLAFVDRVVTIHDGRVAQGSGVEPA